MLPQLDRLVLAGTGDDTTVQSPIQGKDLVLVTRQILLDLTRPHVPHFDRRVFARACQQPGITAPSHHVDGADVAAERRDELAVTRVPQLDAVVKGGRCNVQAVRTERDVQDLLLVAKQSRNRFDRGTRVPRDRRRIPQEYRVVVRCGDELFHQFPLLSRGVFESGFGFLDLCLHRVRHFTRVVVV